MPAQQCGPRKPSVRIKGQTCTSGCLHGLIKRPVVRGRQMVEFIRAGLYPARIRGDEKPVARSCQLGNLVVWLFGRWVVFQYCGTCPAEILPRGTGATCGQARSENGCPAQIKPGPAAMFVAGPGLLAAGSATVGWQLDDVGINRPLPAPIAAEQQASAGWADDDMRLGPVTQIATGAATATGTVMG